MVATQENVYKILLALAEGDKRFSELLKEIKKASLSIELNHLLEMKYIMRKVDSNAKPPTSTYFITKLGKDFLRKKAEIEIPKLTIEVQRLKMVVPERVKEFKESI
jgi:DNA-binding HxlR family transcriptional regulator